MDELSNYSSEESDHLPYSEESSDLEDSSESIAKLTKCMFIHKFRPNLNIYCLIDKNKIIIRNNWKIYTQFDINNAEFEILGDFMHFLNPVIYKGLLYLNYESTLYCLTGNNIYESALSQMARTQDLDNNIENGSFSTDSEESVCALFSFNGKLFLREIEKLYVKEEKGFKFVKDANGFFLQFCNNIFVFNDNTNEIFKLNKNLDYELIMKFQELNKVTLAHGGVIVCYNNSVTYFINMMTCKVVERPYNKEYSHTKIYQQLELGCSGLQLKKEILIDIFGEEFPNQIKQCYDSYIQDQINNFPVYSQNCNSLLPYSVLYQYFSDLDLERKDKIYQNLTSLTNKIRSQEETLCNILEIASQLLNQVVSRFELLSIVEVCQ
ncbi:Conserved_hypothetical protein [Hexamita inflata]|uniref:Uncharacterized protein n=1 Tax=Hexamita inflata TaxID=28002 RepID=A0AA86TID2_9EUKA|nr:Conserved hypothetical protein [Hexamita inflata]CAI9918400.1 Conserved hypothetical protein [Hexamita inflata]